MIIITTTTILIIIIMMMIIIIIIIKVYYKSRARTLLCLQNKVKVMIFDYKLQNIQSVDLL